MKKVNLCEPNVTLKSHNTTCWTLPQMGLASVGPRLFLVQVSFRLRSGLGWFIKHNFAAFQTDRVFRLDILCMMVLEGNFFIYIHIIISFMESVLKFWPTNWTQLCANQKFKNNLLQTSIRWPKTREVKKVLLHY